MKCDLVIASGELGVVDSAYERRNRVMNGVAVKRLSNGVTSVFAECNVKYVDVPMLEKETNE